jgi:uncharacterized protein with von Willebrand factor type A (vWA) domain
MTSDGSARRSGPTRQSVLKFWRGRIKMLDRGIAQKVILFARFLRSHGFKVFSTGIVDALKGLQERGLQDRDDFFNILRANLVAGDMEWKLFKDLFLRKKAVRIKRKRRFPTRRT